MKTLKIGIVEDDLIIAEAIAEMLQECGYEVAGTAMRYSEAIALVEQESPDLLLLDVRILGRMDGIEVGRTIQQSFSLPFIFLTANTDFDTIDRARAVSPAAFLAKPITRSQLYAAIEIAMANHWSALPAGQDGPVCVLPSAAPLFVKEGYHFRKVEEQEILYAESRQNYIELYLQDGRTVTMRATLTEFESRLSPGRFFRVHRGFIVAIDKIEQVTGNAILIRGREITTSRSSREELLRMLGIKKSRE